MSQKKLQVTFIIPTLNRHDDVKRLASSFQKLIKHNHIDCKLIIIDNSKDANAKSLIESLDFNFPSTYIHEPQAGLSYARNAGINAITECDYVFTIDDDIIVPAEYLELAYQAIQKKPEAALLGARVELYNPEDLPVTIKTDTNYCSYTGGVPFGFIFGCAMVIKFSALKQIGLFDVKLGAGTKNPGSEDSDFVYRLWKSKANICYDPKMYVYHNHGRRENHYTIRLLKNYSLGQGGFLAKHLLTADLHSVKIFWWDLNRDLKDWIKRESNNTNYSISKKMKWLYRIKGLFLFLTH